MKTIFQLHVLAIITGILFTPHSPAAPSIDSFQIESDNSQQTASSPSSTPETPQTDRNPGRNSIEFMMHQNRPLSRPSKQPGQNDTAVISESCKDDGNSVNGSTFCKRYFANGSHETVDNRREAIGDDHKKETIRYQYDANGLFARRQAVRHKLSFGYYDYKRVKRAEFFDTVTTLPSGNIIREVMIHEFHLETGKIKTITWTKYDRIGDTMEAALKNHVTLAYDKAGNPVRGKAEKIKDTDAKETMFDWSLTEDGANAFRRNTWNKWEGLIYQMVSRASNI